MVQSVAKKIGNNLIKERIILKQDRELYEFGIVQTINLIIDLLTVIIIGILLGQLWQSLVFTLMYSLIRIYAGGFHAATPWRCSIYSVLFMISAVTLIKYMEVNVWIRLCIMLISGACIFTFAPSEHENKPLSNKEKGKYRVLARFFWLFEIVIALGACYLKLYQLENCILVSLATTSGILMLGIIFKQIKKV